VRGEADGPDEFHLILLDNGRSRVLASPFRESLQCIRCGACLNACPVYRRIGGHAYGGVYSGPIGSILTPLYDSVSDNPHLPHASSLCGACQAACPVRINIPHMLIGLRELQHEAHGGGRSPSHRKRHLDGERLAYWLWKEVLKRPWLYRLALRLGRWLTWPFARGGWLRRLPGPAAGWTQARDFPAPANRSFRERWSEMGPG
jgi:L-lactate dehydrogenase complex protein LldF